jgi:hercynylcysteine S-oxide lyase
VNTIVLIPNATTGVNIILRNLTYNEGDVILYYTPGIYGACECTIDYICETTPATSFGIDISFPCLHDKLLQDFEAAIDEVRAQGKNPKIAIFDTIVSMPGVRMPYEELIAICKRKNVLSLVDAAHCVGMLDPQTDIKLAELDPDFWVSNAHKWMLVPRACAVFFVPTRNQALMRSSLPTSHGFVPLDQGKQIVSPLPAKKKKKATAGTAKTTSGEAEKDVESAKTPFELSFEFVGTLDSSPYFCLPEAIKYREERFGGEAKIAEYLKKLAKAAGEIYSETLGTEVLETTPGPLGECSFSNVRLPLDSALVAKEASMEDHQVGGLVRDWLNEVLVNEHQTFMQFMFYKGSWWVRLSAAVYLEENDFRVGAKLLQSICDRIKQGGWASEE